MSYTLVPMTQKYLEPAIGLFIENYKQEKFKSPLMPSRVFDDVEWIRQVLQSRLTNHGVAVIEQNQLLAYMITGFQYQWKGQQAVLVPEYCHSAVLEKKQELYQQMYMYLSQTWVNNHIHIHAIGHFANDRILQETLYHLGFGAIVAERLRDFSIVNVRNDINIVEEKNVSKLLDLQMEHNRHYPKAPIFIKKTTEKEEVLADLKDHTKQGDVFLVYYEQDKPCAYMIVGKSAINEEGFLLQNTNTAQIKSAYAQQKIRGKGIGKTLLQYAIQWSQQHGYDRIFVEHETANFYGGNFWCKHFTPYVYFSMRYIDNTI